MILPEADAILAGDDSPRLNVRKATFVGVVDGFAQVDMGDSRFVCDFGSGYIPNVGEIVRVWTVGDQHFVFPSGPRPAAGTVLTVSETTVTVQTLTGNLTIPFLAAAPASGDRVGIVWSEDGPWCAGKLSSTPPPPTPIPEPGGGMTQRSAVFRAIDAGTANQGSANWWQPQPWASETTLGGWFYGGQIKDTIPAAARFVSMEFYASWQSRYGGAPRWGVHRLPFKSGVLAVDGAAEWVPAQGWNSLPWAGDWFNALKTGGPYYGIGLQHGGWNKFSSLAEDGMSGALRITWKA